MVQLLDRDLDLSEALDQSLRGVHHPRLRRLISQLSQGLEEGHSLANQMKAYRKNLPLFFRELIQVGEETGKLRKVFDALSRQCATLAPLDRRIQFGWIFPLVVAVVATGFMVYVESIAFTPSRALAPLPSVALICAALIFVDLAVIHPFRPVRWLLDRVKVEIPLWGPLIKGTAVYRFSVAMDLLIEIPGISLTQKWEMASRFTGNLHLTNCLRKGGQVLDEGGRLSEAMRETCLFPDKEMRQIAEAEALGMADEAFSEIAQENEEKLEGRVERISTLTHGAIIFPAVFFLISLIFLAVYRFHQLSPGTTIEQFAEAGLVTIPRLTVVLVFLAVVTRPRELSERLLGKTSKNLDQPS